MKTTSLIFCVALAGAATLWSSVAAAADAMTGKSAPRPLFRDRVYDAPTDPVLCYNAEPHRWLMYYTGRRGTAEDAPGVTWIHGTDIGIAESTDGGATWNYVGRAAIDYAKDDHPKDYTYWAPEVIWHAGTYHMFLSFVPGIFDNWNHPREIVHLTSADGVKWDAVGRLDLGSDRVIDAAVIQLAAGTWRMWYKDERKEMSLSYADSPDLYTWQARGNAVTDYNGEGPKVIYWRGRYWLIADTWAHGIRVWHSDDALNWQPQEATLIGSHGDVVVSGDRAWWFFFGSRRLETGPAVPEGMEPFEPERRGRRTTAINVVELSVKDGELVAAPPELPTTIDLLPEREPES